MVALRDQEGLLTTGGGRNLRFRIYKKLEVSQTIKSDFNKQRNTVKLAVKYYVDGTILPHLQRQD